MAEGQTVGGSIERQQRLSAGALSPAPSDEGAVSRRLTEGEIPPGMQVCVRRTNGAGGRGLHQNLIVRRNPLLALRAASSQPKSRREGSKHKSAPVFRGAFAYSSCDSFRAKSARWALRIKLI